MTVPVYLFDPREGPSIFNDPVLRQDAEEYLAKRWTGDPKPKTTRERLYDALTETPQPLSTICETAGICKKTTQKTAALRRSLDSMARKGLVVTVDHRGHTLYAKT